MKNCSIDKSIKLYLRLQINQSIDTFAGDAGSLSEERVFFSPERDGVTTGCIRWKIEVATVWLFTTFPDGCVSAHGSSGETEIVQRKCFNSLRGKVTAPHGHRKKVPQSLISVDWRLVVYLPPVRIAS